METAPLTLSRAHACVWCSNNVLTHALQAAWLSKLLTGAVALPPPREMQTAVEAEMHWKRTWMPSTSARAAIQQLHMPKYHDQVRGRGRGRAKGGLGLDLP